MTDHPPLIYDLDLPALGEILAAWGEPAYRPQQVWQGLYQNLWATPAEFTNLPNALRQKLGESFTFSHLRLETVLESSDG